MFAYAVSDQHGKEIVIQMIKDMPNSLYYYVSI
jgi:hypothetical protein